MRPGDENSICVRYDHQETGWAVPLGNNLAVIENIPLTHRCNFGDIVRLEAAGADGLPWVGTVIHRRYTAKSVLYYHGLQELQLLCGLLALLGCETEGARQPVDFTPGVLLVAHDRQIRPDLLAGAAGVPQPFGVPTRIAIAGGCLVADTGEVRLEALDGSLVARWQQADWTANPEEAVRILETLLRCVCRGVDEAHGFAPEGEPSPEGGEREGRVRLDPRPLSVRFRRWRHLG